MTYRIKPLVLTKDEFFTGRSAITPFGKVSVIKWDDVPNWWCLREPIGEKFVRTNHSSEAEALAAAESWYHERLMVALEIVEETKNG